MDNAQLEKLRTDRAALLAAADEMTDTIAQDNGRIKKTTEEREKYRKYLSEAEAFGEEIDDLEARLAATAKVEVSKRMVPHEAEIRTVERVDVMPVYNKDQLRAFKGPNALEDAYRASKWVEGNVFGVPEAREWCRAHGVGSEQRVQIEAINAKGGALVPTELDRAIINIRDLYGMARNECRVIQMASDTMDVPRRTSGLTAYFTGEETATTESDTAWDTVNLVAKNLSTLTRISEDFAQDSIISITDMLADEIGQSFAKKEDECLVDGDGTGTYGGMVGFRTLMSVASGNTGSYILATANDDQWGEYIQADLVQVTGKLPEHSQQNAKWYISRIGWGNTFTRLAAAAGGNTLQTLTTDSVSKGFLGYPVSLYAAMPSATTAYDNVTVILFGDLRRSTTMGVRTGIKLKVDSSRYMEFRQIGIMGTERFHIVNHDTGKGATTGTVVAFNGQT